MEANSKILIVEDDIDVAEMLHAYFRVQGYQVETVNWGEDGITAAKENHPGLIILDIRLPDIDGYQVAKRLRENRTTKEIPIIFLTDKRKREDRLHGLELGADDYITKPFDVQELRLRVRNIFRRKNLGSLNNPVTHLPEGEIVDDRLKELTHTKGWAILLISLINFNIFQEAYGFVTSDDTLRAISMMVHNITKKKGSSDDFIGHFASNQLLLITSSKTVKELNSQVQTSLEQSLDYFYPLKDRGEEQSDIPNKLKIQITQLDADQGPFSDVEAIKSHLTDLALSFDDPS